MWNWWNSMVSGNTLYYVNPSRDNLIKHCLVEDLHPVKLNRPFDIHQLNDDEIVSPSEFCFVNQEIDAEDFFQLKEEILTRINFGKPHTYIVDRSINFSDRKPIGVRLITTSPYDAYLLELYDFREVKNADLITVFTDHRPREKQIIAFSRDTNEIVILGNPQGNILSQLRFLFTRENLWH